MKKTTLMMLVIMLMILTLTGCKSTAEKAKEAFDEKDYEKVVKVLSKGTEDDAELERYLKVANANLAFEAEEYSSVVEILDGKTDEDPELEKMLSISQANISYGNEEYDKVVNYLYAYEEERAKSIYTESLEQYKMQLLESKDVEKLVDLYNKDNSIGNDVFDVIKTKCDELEFEEFVFMDKLIGQLPEGDLLTHLKAYSEEHIDKRIKSFLIGEWEWEADLEKRTRVKVIEHKDDLLCTVTQVSDQEAEYQIMLNDIYWRDFEYIDDKTYTCINLTKTRDGLVVDVTAYCVLDYENQKINIHLTAPAPYHMVDADRTWNKLK